MEELMKTKVVDTTTLGFFDPRSVVTTRPKSSYQVPIYQVSDEGLKTCNLVYLDFCKGNKEDSTIHRQVGFLSETLIAASKLYLEENNVGDLASRETSMVITKLDEALMWLQTYRAIKREFDK